jgi:hypothetical protein
MQSSVFKLTDLKQRKEPKKSIDFEFFMNDEDEEKEPKQKKDEDETVKEKSVKIDSNEESESESESESEKKIETTSVVFKDNLSTSKIDRNLVLKRLHRAVESKLISKAPTDEESPVKKSKVLERPEYEGEEEDVLKKNMEEGKEENIKKTRPKKGKIPDHPTGSLLDEEEVFRPLEEEPYDLPKESAIELEPEKPKKGKKKTTEKSEGSRVNLSIAKIGDQLIVDRLPPRGKYAVPVSSYYMNNRKIYISKLAQLFRPYSEKIASKAAQLSCKTLHTQSVDFELLTHQLVVRDYLNLYTPYRGLLLYHGLGSGKTCTSIGIAEGMKSGKQIVLMTPASLKMNFFNELKKCGDVLYRKTQFWEFVPLEGDPQRASLLAQALGLETDYVRKRHGAWLMNVKKPPNFAELSDSDQKSVDAQIDHMIRNKYIDINYNGIRKEVLEQMSQGGKVNIFDNKVVIIDEVHNLVSNISNSGDKKGSKAYRLYRDLMDATNAKIIFLTGTPIINTPREIAILFNMLRGYIKTWTFSLETTTSDKINTEILMNVFRVEGLTMYDYVEYTTNRLVITRNPFGFVNVYKKDERRKGGSQKKGKKNKTKKPSMKNSTSVTKKNYDMFENEKTNEEIEMEYRRMHSDIYEGGGAAEEYAGVRLDEMGNISDAVFEKRLIKILVDLGIRVVGKAKIKKETCLPDKDDLFREMFINGEKGEVINTDVLKRRILGLTSYFRSAQEQLLPAYVKTADGANYNIVNVDMSDYQFEEYEKVRKEEREEEKRRRRKTKKPQLDELDEKTAGTYRIYSRSACNFVFPAEHHRPTGYKHVDDVDEFDGVTEEEKRSRDDYFEDVNEFENLKFDEVAEQGAKGAVERSAKDTREIEDRGAMLSRLTTIETQQEIQKTYDFLKYDPARKRDKEYLTEEGLRTYSPKFLEILHNITDEDHKGLHLVYSQWRTLEGIGLFKLVLESNGFVELKLVQQGSTWDIVDWEKDPEKPRYALYTGTESAEEKDIVRNIFNGSWHLVPPSIVEKLRERHENNLYGEIIKILMITASGAEGINLRNTRYVHIMEPYWNMVRVDQVVGRARRICSHEDLPEELRTVEVYIYLSTATEEQIDKNIELRIQDLSKLQYKIHDEKRGRDILERVPFTTDQYLLEIAQIKDSITRQILTSVKETAIDCSLYNTNPAEPLVCYGFGKVEAQSFASYPTLERDTQEKSAVRTEKKRLVSLMVEDVKYAVDKNTMIVYDFASYEKAKEKRGELVEVGRYDERTKTIIR